MPDKYTPPKVIVSCVVCNSTFLKYSSLVKSRPNHCCSRKCQSDFTSGPRNPNWHGGLIVRFWRKVSKGDGCWEWTGAINGHGYGFISAAIGHKKLLAHRASWMINKGPIPEGMLVCHHCDNRSCVNPDHLFIGTHNDNSLDKLSKGREARGERSGSSKLVDAQVLEIRELLKVFTATEIARRFHVSCNAILKIKNGRTWSHLEGETNGNS